VTAEERLGDGWHHVAGVLSADRSLKLYVDGKLAASAKAASLIPIGPKQPLELGGDSGGSVGDYRTPFAFTGAIDELRIFHRALTPEEIAESARDAEQSRKRARDAVLALSFDSGNAKDESGNKNDGRLGNLPTGQGKVGTAVMFPKAATGQAAQQGGLAFEHRWTRFTPVFARAMVLAKGQLVVAGPPDEVDEEYALERLAAKDPVIQEELKRQDETLDGLHGGRLMVLSTEDGSRVREIELESLPVWDGMVTAYGKLFMATTDGRVVCIGQ
jgi:hypothetical protein